MRHQTAAITAAVVIASGSGVGLIARGLQASLQPVTISAVVVDRNGAPVRNLAPDDFRISENGKPMAVTRFDVTTLGASTTNGRAVTLILGAGGTDPELTVRVQKVARDFFGQAASNDRVSVVRSAFSRRDELAGTRQDMLMRVAEYRAPMGEPVNLRTPRDVLDLVAKVSKEMVDEDMSRRAIVFIGSPYIYDVVEPQQRESELEWPNWVAALQAAARANVSVYVIDPAGLTGQVRINPDGLVAQTGGMIFYNRNDLERAVNLVWGETSSYYTLDYDAAPSREALQKINVTLSRPGLTIRARRSR